MINSLFFESKFWALGIAIALLIIAKGIAFASPILNVVFPKYWKAKASPKLNNNIGRNAIRDVFPTKGNFDLLSSNSNEPSKTISINPIVPKIGKDVDKSGIGISK